MNEAEKTYWALDDTAKPGQYAEWTQVVKTKGAISGLLLAVATQAPAMTLSLTARTAKDLAASQLNANADRVKFEGGDLMNWSQHFSPLLPCHWPPKKTAATCVIVVAYADGQHLDNLTGPIERTEPWGLARINLESSEVKIEILAKKPNAASEGVRPVTSVELKLLNRLESSEDLLFEALRDGKFPASTDQKSIRAAYASWLNVTAPDSVRTYLGSKQKAFVSWAMPAKQRKR